MADIQINATGGDVTEQTSIQIRRGSTATDSPPVEDDVEQFSAHEREELTETGVSREGRRSSRRPDTRIHYITRILLCISQERDTGFWRVGSAIIR